MKSRCSRTTRETEATYHALFTNIQADRLTLPAVLSHPTSFPHISFTLAFHSAITTPLLSRTPTHFIIHAIPVPLHLTTSIPSPIHPPPYIPLFPPLPTSITHQTKKSGLSKDRPDRYSIGNPTDYSSIITRKPTLRTGCHGRK